MFARELFVIDFCFLHQTAQLDTPRLAFPGTVRSDHMRSIRLKLVSYVRVQQQSRGREFCIVD